MMDVKVEELHAELHKGVKMIVDALGDMCQQENVPASFMMDMSGILKDMSKVEKNLAEAAYYARKA